MTTQDAANEVVRAAVEWKNAFDAEARTGNGGWQLVDRSWELRDAVEAYLANNLPDSAQHPTPNPG